jgi:hypothetical protein
MQDWNVDKKVDSRLLQDGESTITLGYRLPERERAVMARNVLAPQCPLIAAATDTAAVHEDHNCN